MNEMKILSKENFQIRVDLRLILLFSFQSVVKDDPVPAKKVRLFQASNPPPTPLLTYCASLLHPMSCAFVLLPQRFAYPYPLRIPATLDAFLNAFRIPFITDGLRILVSVKKNMLEINCDSLL